MVGDDPAAAFLRWRVKKLSAPSEEIGENMFTLNKVSIESIYDGYVAYCERVGCKPASYATWKLLTKS
jgi:hypothetical protein